MDSPICAISCAPPPGDRWGISGGICYALEVGHFPIVIHSKGEEIWACTLVSYVAVTCNNSRISSYEDLESNQYGACLAWICKRGCGSSSAFIEDVTRRVLSSSAEASTWFNTLQTISHNRKWGAAKAAEIHRRLILAIYKGDRKVVNNASCFILSALDTLLSQICLFVMIGLWVCFIICTHGLQINVLNVPQECVGECGVFDSRGWWLGNWKF